MMMRSYLGRVEDDKFNNYVDQNIVKSLVTLQSRSKVERINIYKLLNLITSRKIEVKKK